MPLPSDPDGDDVSGDGVGCLKCRKDVNYDQVRCVFLVNQHLSIKIVLIQHHDTMPARAREAIEAGFLVFLL